jgi:ribosomal protein L29
MVTDDDRRNLHEALEGTLGRVPAATLMALLPPVGWSEVATQAGVDASGLALRGEMAELRAELKGEMADLRAELKGEMADLRAELKGEMAELRGEMAELRAEMRSMLPKLVTANIASMIGVAGLVLGAVSLG